MTKMKEILNRATRQTRTGWVYLAFSTAAITWAYSFKTAIITAVIMLTVCVTVQLVIARFYDGLRGRDMWSKAYRRAMGVRDGRRPFQTFPSDI